MKKYPLLSLLATMPLCAARCADIDLYQSLLVKETPRHGEGITVTWLGTAGLLISDGQTALLIDPYVSRFGMGKVFFQRPLASDRELVRKWSEKLGKKNIRAVIVSHSHFDHLADAPLFARETGAPLIGTESTLNAGRGAGLREDELRLVKPGQAMPLGRFTLRFIESVHGPVFGSVPYPGVIDKPLAQPARAKDYRLGGVFGIVIGHPSGTILHHGSAGFVPGMYDGVTADVVFLGIASSGGIEEYIREVPLRVKAKTLIPAHVDNFFKPLEQGFSLLPLSVKFKEFCDTAGRYRDSFALKTLPIGRPVRVLPVAR
ncbi:MAG TPA: MBL fold metallo-hydrolase [Spirochaetota bacterium]|nr:MBL fold metallo-hydrolase [Spirochaetota bacterium]